MSHWLVHREQVSLEFQMEMFPSLSAAQQKQHQLRQQYHDAVILEEKDVEKLYHYQKARRHEK